ncbi:MAG: hypothetical protein ABEJ61_03670 [Haloferacaceae archaeon]
MGNDDLEGLVAEVKSRKRLVPRDYGLWELAIIGGMLVTVWLPLFVVAWTTDKVKSLVGADEQSPSDEPRTERAE